MPKSQTLYEISVLEALQAKPEVGQRDLAEATGLSLGMINLVLKNLSGKGWMKMRRLSSRKMQYLLTPEGVRELTQRSFRFVSKTIQDVTALRVRCEDLVLRARSSGAAGVCLVGPSELEFVVEYFCLRHAFPFRSTMEARSNDGWFYIFSESEPEATPNVLEFVSMRSS